ncbi:MAG: S8 family serine peptidase [Alphaproteobacteria bacterium]|nr:S8 family serine peptidase [Alphaproteobacteria bacterium]
MTDPAPPQPPPSPYYGFHIVARPDTPLALPYLGEALGPPTPTFSGLSPQVLQLMVQMARARTPAYEPPDFASWYTVPSNDLPAALGVLRRLRAKGTIRAFHVAHVPSNPTFTAAEVGGGGFTPNSAPQTHLDDAPIGVGARSAWAWKGARGATVGFADVEQGWDLDQVDLPVRAVVYGTSQTDSEIHGTASIGLVGALGTDDQVSGLAPDLPGMRLASYLDGHGNLLGVQNALLAVGACMAAGDVILAEVQTTVLDSGGDQVNAPIEQDMAIYEAIKLLTCSGIIVIEPSGNSKIDVTTLGPPTPVTGAAVAEIARVDPGRADASRARAPVHTAAADDSGAVMVGGATYKGRSWQRAYNYGTRIDCHGQAAYVRTLGGGPPYSAVDAFNGTSSASAIVAGVAVCIQGALDAAGKPRLTPAQMRVTLATGTPVLDDAGAVVGHIPDLVAILEALVGPGEPSVDKVEDVDLEPLDVVSETEPETSTPVVRTPPPDAVTSRTVDEESTREVVRPPKRTSAAPPADDGIRIEELSLEEDVVLDLEDDTTDDVSAAAAAARKERTP